MQRSPFRVLLSIILVFQWVVAPTLLAKQVAGPAGSALCLPSVTPGVDNRDGYLPPFEEQPVRPLALSPNGEELWVINIPDARVSVFDATHPAAGNGPVLLAEIAVGLGPVTIQRRPGSLEMWVVCTSSNSIFVIDTQTRRIQTTIRVEHEPADLVFDAAGATAYVSVAASNQIAVIGAASRQVTTRIEFDSILPSVGGSRIHAEEPRALLLEGNNLYGLSHLSGNGSAANPAGMLGALSARCAEYPWYVAALGHLQREPGAARAARP